MNEIYAKPIVDGFLWMVEQNGEKIATLQKQDNKFLLCNRDSQLLVKHDELLSQFGDKFFLPPALKIVPKIDSFDCYGFTTTMPVYNAMYDVRRNLPLYTEQSGSKCYHCAGWYAVKMKDWVYINCPKLLLIERNSYLGPFKSEHEAEQALCNK